MPKYVLAQVWTQTLNSVLTRPCIPQDVRWRDLFCRGREGRSPCRCGFASGAEQTAPVCASWELPCERQLQELSYGLCKMAWDGADIAGRTWKYGTSYSTTLSRHLVDKLLLLRVAALGSPCQMSLCVGPGMACSRSWCNEILLFYSSLSLQQHTIFAKVCLVSDCIVSR